MIESAQPTVTPDKIYPLVRNADADQIGTLYRLAHHMIRGSVPQAEAASVRNFMDLMNEGTQRQLLLIFQAAYHLVHKERMT